MKETFWRSENDESRPTVGIILYKSHSKLKVFSYLSIVTIVNWTLDLIVDVS
jgi:hypothetical protein